MSDESSISVIEKFNKIASTITVEELDDWTDILFSYYHNKIHSLAIKSYGETARATGVASLAFKEQAKIELKSALNTFLFKSEHWRTGRDINSYLHTCLNRLSDRILADVDNVKKYNCPICPGCKHLGIKTFLFAEGKLLKCDYCNKESDRLPNEILLLKNKINLSIQDKQNISLFESRLRIHKTFAIHSKKGYRCTDCQRFIPESLATNHGISCPYDDCDFFSKIEKLEIMAHPVSMSTRLMMHFEDKDNNSANSIRRPNTVFLNSLNIKADNIDADINLEINETIEIEFEQLTSVIDEQVKSIKRINSSSTMMQKLLMYQAYQNMLEQFPEEMISYLVHRKQAAEFPIQSRIFQEYAKLMQESLPFTIERDFGEYTVYDLLDPQLQLFSGKSEFETEVQYDHSIPNKTIETYVGGTSFKDYGPCFIGSLIDVVDKNTGFSIKDKVKNYTFSQINMTDEVLYNTPVTVKHFRIKSHYEIGSLVYLQRIRKRIVDGVYFKLHGKKRMAS